jgi:hypothetical protein
MEGDISRMSECGFRAQNGDRRGWKATAAVTAAGLSRAALEAACVGASPAHPPLRVTQLRAHSALGTRFRLGLASGICAFSAPANSHLMLNRGD